ncbi:MAG: pyruvate kinase [Acidobacteria bacterium]|nr:pyruvate kinase [Acidobacteriota bacterium]
MKNPRLTRIIATLGPGSANRRTLRRLVAAGMDAARLNMSHGTHADHRRMARLVRQAAHAAGRPIGLMVDLQGPKLRLGDFAGPLRLRHGMTLTLTTRAAEADPAAGVIPVAYADLPVEAAPGHELLLMDGLVRLEVQRIARGRVICRVVEGEELTARAGLFLPQAKAVRLALSAKDRRDLALAVELQADFLALSFVRRAQDLVQARRLLRRLGGDQLLVAKIETRQALENLDEILLVSDAVLVARGDLGVALSPEQVPVEQKRILNACWTVGLPSIIATQMLESMRHSSRPTRAEASDVANAVLDGAWAVMLTAETAVGEYPVESVAMMDRIVRSAEPMLFRQPRRPHSPAGLRVAEALAEAAVTMAIDANARVVVALTRSGATARQLARYPLRTPTLAYTPNPRTLTRLTLMRGAVPRRLREQPSLDCAIRRIEADLRRRKEIARGDLIVVLGGSPEEPLGTVSRLALHRVR